MIRLCKKCGFILDTRPGLRDIDGICMPCINSEKKKSIDFVARQQWLTEHIKNKISDGYDCVVAVSGGKDSHMIVSNLVEYHGISNPLLVTVCDEFTPSQAGKFNRKNISEFFGCDHMIYRSNPKDFIKNTLHDFESTLHPLKWIEERLYAIPIHIAKKFGIKLVFFGENPAYEYGSADDLEIFHPSSDDTLSIIFLGAIYPYSTQYALDRARQAGFKDLEDFKEWPRGGCIERFAQIDSFGYLVHLWCKFPKFGFQRVSDMACRFVREGILSREQALQHIREKDYILDYTAKYDFCRCLGISETYFDSVVDRHVNTNLLTKDVNGTYRRRDCL